MNIDRKPSVSFDTPHRVRAKSHSETRSPRVVPLSPSQSKRNHSSSVSSVTSQMSDEFEVYAKRNPHYSDDFDLEKQLIISAGGKNASVCCFLLKVLFLTTVVLGCGVLVFYAL